MNMSGDTCKIRGVQKEGLYSCELNSIYLGLSLALDMYLIQYQYCTRILKTIDIDYAVMHPR
jgi:hypothetical protein